MKRTKYVGFILLILGIILVFSMAGCGKKKAMNNSISIAEQYGIAYAPLQIMKENKILERNLPGIQVNWVQLSNTASIREAMLSNKVDAGFMAIPPFLVGLDKGMDWKIASGLSSSPTGLVTNSDKIKTIKDFTDKDKIAVPQPGSVQHILLSMACEGAFKDSHKLDNLLVTMSHPDGMSALLAKKDITAHFTAPPYLNKELKVQGSRQILDGREAFGGDFTFITGVTTKKFHDKSPEAYSAFVKSIQESIDYINKNPEKSAEILAPIYKISKEEVLEYLKTEGTEYSLEVKGLSKFMSFMKSSGYISKEYDAKEIYWDDVKYEK